MPMTIPCQKANLNAKAGNKWSPYDWAPNHRVGQFALASFWSTGNQLPTGRRSCLRLANRFSAHKQEGRNSRFALLYRSLLFWWVRRGKVRFSLPYRFHANRLMPIAAIKPSPPHIAAGRGAETGG